MTDPELVKLRSSYWTKRLDHTLTHTQTASRLIYAIDGAVLALGYFSARQFSFENRGTVVAFAVLAFVLGALNALHARFIAVQNSWYAGIDKKLIKLLEVTPVEHAIERKWLASTHGIYETMHGIVAVVLFVIGGILLMAPSFTWRSCLTRTGTPPAVSALAPCAASASPGHASTSNDRGQ